MAVAAGRRLAPGLSLTSRARDARRGLRALRKGDRADSMEIHAQRARHRALLADESAPLDPAVLQEVRAMGFGRRPSRKAAVQRLRGEGRAEYIGGGLSGQWPPNPLPEVGIIGQSNSGKSSLLNAMLGSVDGAGIAGVSSRPGWTARLEFYRISADYEGEYRPWFVLVDMPGYGSAVASKSTRQQWRKSVNLYLAARPELLSVLVLVDCERGLLADDVQFVQRLTRRRVPFHVLLTRCDVLTDVELARCHHAVVAALDTCGCTDAAEDVPMTSALTGVGIRELWQRLLRGVNEHTPGESPNSRDS